MNFDEIWRREQQLQEEQLEAQRLRDQELQEQQLREQQQLQDQRLQDQRLDEQRLQQEQQLREQQLRAQHLQDQQLQEQRQHQEARLQQDLDQQLQQETSQVFEEYARQQQQEELAKLSQQDRANFERLVSEKEREQLIELSAQKLEEEYKLQQSEEINIALSNNSGVEQTSLTQEYFDFKKNEETSKELENESNTFSDSGTDVKTWFYTKAASEELLINSGIDPNTSITPSGAIWLQELVRDNRIAQAEQMIETEKGRLKEEGLSPRQISEREGGIRTQAFDKVMEEWRSERNEMLTRWQERQAEKSFQEFESQGNSIEQYSRIPDSLRAKVEAQREKYGTTERQPEKSPDKSQELEW